MDNNLYSILGVASDASHAEIKAAYRELAWRYHPDVNKSPGAVEMMARINVAYAVLGNPAKRKAYGSKRPPPGPGADQVVDSFSKVFR
jgi:DnaJ-class molecular chaperone